MSTVYRAICAVIRNEENKILVEDHVKIGGLCLPGGKNEAGEDDETALKRELKEELGIDTESVDFSKRIYFHDIPYPVGTGEVVDFDQYFFIVNSFTGTRENKEPEKHKELLWLSEEELLSKDNVSTILREYLTTK